MTVPELLSFALQCLVLLAAPGPTNALLAAAGSLKGFRLAGMLILAVIAAYGLSIGLLIGVAGPAAENNPALGLTLKLTAALFLGWSAIKMWRTAKEGKLERPVTLLSLFLTTLINPKGLVFAFGIFPGPSVILANPGVIGVFMLAVMVSSLAWIGIGKAIATGAGAMTRPGVVGRVTALVLGFFSLLLVGSVSGQILSP